MGCVWVDSLRLATCQPASFPGCCYFLFIWLLIGCHPEWTTHTHTHTHRHTDTDTKKNILFSLSAWNLPSSSYLKKHSVLLFNSLTLSADVTRTKWPPRFESADGKSTEELRAADKGWSARLWAEAQIKMFSFQLWNYLRGKWTLAKF